MRLGIVDIVSPTALCPSGSTFQNTSGGGWKGICVDANGVEVATLDNTPSAATVAAQQAQATALSNTLIASGINPAIATLPQILAASGNPASAAAAIAAGIPALPSAAVVQATGGPVQATQQQATQPGNYSPFYWQPPVSSQLPSTSSTLSTSSTSTSSDTLLLLAAAAVAAFLFLRK